MANCWIRPTTAQQIADLIHSWVPTRTADPDTQHELTQLRSQLAQLRQRMGEDTGDTSTPTNTGPSASSPTSTLIQQALLRNSNSPAPPAPAGFDPSCLLVCPTTVNPWLAQHLPPTLAVRASTNGSRICQCQTPRGRFSLTILPKQKNGGLTNRPKPLTRWNELQ